MNDMSAVIVPKSDQLNADSLIAGPITITITKVDIQAGTEQPVAISFEGDAGCPWKPCKSMSRVLVAAWGPDAKAYIGRSVTLYRDPKVKWGGMEVGGIRISHLSHIETAMNLALTATKGKRTPYIVKPLPTGQGRAQQQAPAQQQETDEPSPLDLQNALRAAKTMDELGAVWMRDEWKRARKVWSEATVTAVTKVKDDRKAELSAPAQDEKPATNEDVPF